jgi:hypothetical protein
VTAKQMLSSLPAQRHLFKELIYVVSGPGAMTVWNHPESKHRFEWREGSVFSPPSPAFQRQRQRTGPLSRGDDCAPHDQSASQH